jgi:hypothetical protein
MPYGVILFFMIILSPLFPPLFLASRDFVGRFFGSGR